MLYKSPVIPGDCEDIKVTQAGESLKDAAPIGSEARRIGDWRLNLGRTDLGDFQTGARIWWTGKQPSSCIGFDPIQGVLRATEPPSLADCSREEVRDYFDNGWTMTELLFSGLATEESFYIPPYHELRHPLIFYYVHPVAFYVNKLRLAGIIDEPVDAYFEGLFDIGVDEMSWDDMSKNHILWPSIDECRDYRAKVYELITGIIQGESGLAPGHDRIGWHDKLWTLFMGFEHERIHIETSSALIRELPLRLVVKPDAFPHLSPGSHKDSDSRASFSAQPQVGVDYPVNEFIDVEPGQVQIGKERDFPSYGWDNEYGSRSVSVAAFAAGKFLISNGEFHEFVRSGAYKDAKYWTEEGFAWRTFRDVSMPTFWLLEDGQYKLRTIFEVVDMPWSWPCVVNFHEAKAFASWKAELDGRSAPYRLLTEAQHMRLRQLTGLDSAENALGAIGKRFNIGLKQGSESAVQDGLDGQFSDLFGNVWQWMEDHFHPLEGFAIHEYYDDFSTPCFDGKHHMIIGGSFISIGDEASPYARFHFRPHFFQHAGIRLAALEEGDDGSVKYLPAS